MCATRFKNQMATHVDAARKGLADRGSTPLVSTNLKRNIVKLIGITGLWNLVIPFLLF